MSSRSLRRLVSVATAALLALTLIGPGVATATVASMQFIDPTYLPPVVSPGANAGYSFTIHNGGSSNISQLTLSAPSNGVPVYFSNDYGTTCQLSPSLSCAFGSLPSGGNIKIVVAYDTSGSASPFTAMFKLDSTGGPTSDGHHSHGDSVSYTFSTTLSGDQNFAGGFQLTGTEISTTGILSKKNKQQSSVVPPTGSTLIPVTIQDGLTSPPSGGADPCTATGTTFHCIGDWTSIHVGKGSEGPIKLTLVLYGPSVPGGANVNNIGLWHDGSTPNPITLRCSDPSSIPNHGTAECVTVTLVGNNFQIVAWLLHNGGAKGLY